MMVLRPEILRFRISEQEDRPAVEWKTAAVGGLASCRITCRF